VRQDEVNQFTPSGAGCRAWNPASPKEEYHVKFEGRKASEGKPGPGQVLRRWQQEAALPDTPFLNWCSTAIKATPTDELPRRLV
jgi:hypothetical protein